MATTPREIAALVRRYYPQLADHTNIGSRQDASHIAGIVDALETIPDLLVPREYSVPFANIKGRLRSAVRTWEAGGIGRHYLSGGDLIELLDILAQLPDRPSISPDETDGRTVTLEKPLVFISCGQYTEEEVALGKAIERSVKEDGRYDAYFAEQQNSLEGLSSNILSSLGRCSAFVGVMHHRGVVIKPSGEVVRASVWVEQEIAIAAFIQHALKRKIEVALYVQKGIVREGIREQLRLAPVEFAAPDDVLTDLRQRLTGWNLETSPSYSLVAEWKRETVRIQSKRHDYRFVVDLINKGSVQITDWRVRVEFPREFPDDSVTTGSVYEDNSALYSPNAARLYPGDRRSAIINLPYHVDESNYDLISQDYPSVLLHVSSGDMPPSKENIPMSRLHEY